MVRGRVLQTPKKKARNGLSPLTCTISVAKHSQQPGPPPQAVLRCAAPAARLFVCNQFVQQSPPLTPSPRLIQVAEISSEQMEEDIEVVEELSMPPRAGIASPPTLPGDIMSTNNMVPTEWRISPMRVLDLSEEMDKLAVIHQDVVKEAREHVARMNSLGLFVDASEMN